MIEIVAGGHYQSISCLPENSKGARDKVAKYFLPNLDQQLVDRNENPHQPITQPMTKHQGPI